LFFSFAPEERKVTHVTLVCTYGLPHAVPPLPPIPGLIKHHLALGGGKKQVSILMYVKKKRIFLIGKIQKRIKLVSNNLNRQANGRHLLHSTVLSLLLLSAGSWAKDVPSVHRLWTLNRLVLCRARPLLSPRVVKAPSSGGLGLFAFSGLVCDLLLRGLKKGKKERV